MKDRFLIKMGAVYGEIRFRAPGAYFQRNMSLAIMKEVTEDEAVQMVEFGGHSKGLRENVSKRSLKGSTNLGNGSKRVAKTSLKRFWMARILKLEPLPLYDWRNKSAR